MRNAAGILVVALIFSVALVVFVVYQRQRDERLRSATIASMKPRNTEIWSNLNISINVTRDRAVITYTKRDSAARAPFWPETQPDSGRIRIPW